MTLSSLDEDDNRGVPTMPALSTEAVAILQFGIFGQVEGVTVCLQMSVAGSFSQSASDAPKPG